MRFFEGAQANELTVEWELGAVVVGPDRLGQRQDLLEQRALAGAVGTDDDRERSESDIGLRHRLEVAQLDPSAFQYLEGELELLELIAALAFHL